VPPPARDEELQLHRVQSALAAVLLGEVHKGPADAGAAATGGGDGALATAPAGSRLRPQARPEATRTD
jgi:hypothetical protein